MNKMYSLRTFVPINYAIPTVLHMDKMYDSEDDYFMS